MDKFLISMALLGLVAMAPAQDVLDFTEIRNLGGRLSTAGMLRLGYLWAQPDGEDKARDKVAESVPDVAFQYVTQDFLQKKSSIAFYGGREGLYLATGNSSFDTETVRSRFEAWYRPWSIYREGFYQGSKFIPTHRYQGEEYRGRLGFQVPVNVSGNAKAEAATFWGRNHFSRFSQTLGPSTQYFIPDDYQVYGIRISLEWGEFRFDRYSDLPVGGFSMTLWGEREDNDSDDIFGTPGWQARLPKSVWRGGGRLQYYLPVARNHVLDIKAMGRYYDEEDRVHIFDASKPIGNRSVAGSIGYRWSLSPTFYIMPFVSGQYVRVTDEFGLSEKNKYFYGGGCAVRYTVSENFSFYLDYSYQENAAQSPILRNKDHLGEHRLAAGIELYFGG